MSELEAIELAAVATYEQRKGEWLARAVEPRRGRAAIVRAVGGPGHYQGQREEFQIAFGTSSGVERFVFSRADAELIAADLAEGLARYSARTNSQSPMSSGIPRVAGSMPDEGQSV